MKVFSKVLIPYEAIQVGDKIGQGMVASCEGARNKVSHAITYHLKVPLVWCSEDIMGIKNTKK